MPGYRFMGKIKKLNKKQNKEFSNALTNLN